MPANARVFRSPCALCLSLAVWAPAVALGQTLPSIDMRTWRPSSDPDAGLVLEPVTAPGSWQWNVGEWTHYEQTPIVLRDAATGAIVLRPIEHAVGADLVAGIGLGDRAAVGFALPFFLWQDGPAGLPPSVVSRGQVPSTGLGDAAIDGKATILSNDRQGVRGGLGLAALGTLTLPTGSRESFSGDGSVTASLVLLGEYALGVGAVRATLGYKLRTDRRKWPASNPDGVTFGDEAPWSIGVSIRPKAFAPAVDAGDRQTWEIALHGSVPAGPVAPFGLGGGGASTLSPVMVAVDDRIALGRLRDVSAVVGGDFGLDGAAGVPVFRAVVSLGWAPRAHDRDADGVPDDIDECPDLPEDKDGVQDADGCPEDDADGDGVLDDQDACPLAAGPPSSDPRMNGCPTRSEQKPAPLPEAR